MMAVRFNCSDYQSIKERNCDDFDKSRIDFPQAVYSSPSNRSLFHVSWICHSSKQAAADWGGAIVVETIGNNTSN